GRTPADALLRSPCGARVRYPGSSVPRTRASSTRGTVDGIDQPFEVGVIVRRSAEGSGGTGPDGEVAQDRQGRDGGGGPRGSGPLRRGGGGPGRWWGAGRDNLVRLGEDDRRGRAGGHGGHADRVGR